MMQAIDLFDYSLEEELKSLVDTIVEKCNPQKIILFGSMANGKQTVWSDIDLVIIMDTDLRYIDRLLYISQIAKCDVPVDFFVYTPEEERRFIETNNLFYTKEVIEKGKVLYEREL
ncbi:nucleotidyltransferase domain-containing protein [Thermoanaerobacterium thermosaccharolyticum]|nr:nucleotidyltransferase domain-containing protein [Thermoanaerobacterium thermosaccharolyticum]